MTCTQRAVSRGARGPTRRTAEALADATVAAQQPAVEADRQAAVAQQRVVERAAA